VAGQPAMDKTPIETLTPKPGSINNSGTTSLNIFSFPVPFPLGLHVLLHGLLNLTCPTSGANESIREKGSAAYKIHAPSKGAVQHSSNLAHPRIYALGQLTSVTV